MTAEHQAVVAGELKLTKTMNFVSVCSCYQREIVAAAVHVVVKNFGICSELIVAGVALPPLFLVTATCPVTVASLCAPIATVTVKATVCFFFFCHNCCLKSPVPPFCFVQLQSSLL